MATIKAAEIWNPNTQYSGGSCGVVLPCAATQELIDRLTSEWESYTDGREIRAIAIDLPDGWQVVENQAGEGVMMSETGEIVLPRGVEPWYIVAYTTRNGAPHRERIMFKAWRGEK